MTRTHECRFDFDAWRGHIARFGHQLRPAFWCLEASCSQRRARVRADRHDCDFSARELVAVFRGQELFACSHPTCDGMAPERDIHLLMADPTLDPDVIDELSRDLTVLEEELFEKLEEVQQMWSRVDNLRTAAGKVSRWQR